MMYNVCMCVVSQEVCMAAAPRTDEAGCVRGGRLAVSTPLPSCATPSPGSCTQCYFQEKEQEKYTPARPHCWTDVPVSPLSLSLFLILPLSCWDWLVLWKGYARKELCQLDATSRGGLLEASQGYTAQSEGPCVISFLVTHLDAGKECCAQWGREGWL